MSNSEQSSLASAVSGSEHDLVFEAAKFWNTLHPNDGPTPLELEFAAQFAAQRLAASEQLNEKLVGDHLRYVDVVCKQLEASEQRYQRLIREWDEYRNEARKLYQAAESARQQAERELTLSHQHRNEMADYVKEREARVQGLVDMVRKLAHGYTWLLVVLESTKMADKGTIGITYKELQQQAMALANAALKETDHAAE